MKRDEFTIEMIIEEMEYLHEISGFVIKEKQATKERKMLKKMIQDLKEGTEEKLEKYIREEAMDDE